VGDVCQAGGTCETEIDTEPNDSEATAVDLGEVDCNMVGEVNGSIAMGTSDWFTFHGNDAMSCMMDSIAIVNNDVSEDLTVCMYFGCDMGNANVVCPGDATEDTTPDGLPGCCRAGDVTFQSQACMGAVTDDSGTVVLRVDGSSSMECVDYALAYRFF
jgi:hypothetical protein